ncbi:hypothetical protein F2Q70_00005125 [Brassica cretica]|uniref:Uncharacterized protein n=1 Tax=Brassica cretica TaxID=69181 RepID=A0A8S9J4G5_BRACR|nr:hypothetical protein F2Q70_00005125 [Brassica cretica]
MDPEIQLMDFGIEWNRDIASESGDVVGTRRSFLESGASLDPEVAFRTRRLSKDPKVRPLPVPIGISHSAARKLATIEFPCCMLLLEEATIRLRGCWIEAGVGAGVGTSSCGCLEIRVLLGSRSSIFQNCLLPIVCPLSFDFMGEVWAVFEPGEGSAFLRRCSMTRSGCSLLLLSSLVPGFPAVVSSLGNMLRPVALDILRSTSP